jgi:hypothetical protein
MQLDLFTSPTPRMQVCAEVPNASGYLPVYRVQLVHETVIPANRPQLGSSADAARPLRQFLHQVDREHFVVILVDRKNPYG